MVDISRLATEIVDAILQHFDGVSLARAECVCKKWRELLSRKIYNEIWRRNCLNEIDVNVLEQITGNENILFCQLTGLGSCNTHVWKTIYRRWFICRKVGKWPVARTNVGVKCSPVAERSYFGEITGVKISNDVVYAANDGGRIQSWDSWVGNCLHTVNTDPLTTIAVFQQTPDTLLVFCATTVDSICLWCVETGVCEAVIYGHDNTVSCLAVCEEPYYLVSGSFDQTIKLWDFHQDSEFTMCIKTLRGHDKPVTDLSVFKMKVLSVAANAVKLWSLDSGECLYTVPVVHYVDEYITEGCVLRGAHALVLRNNGEVLFCDFQTPETDGRDVYNVNTCTHKLLNYADTKSSHVSCLATYGNLMAIACDAGLVHIFHYKKDWSEKTPDILHVVRCGKQYISCLALSCDNQGPMLVAGFTDGTILIYRWFSPSVD